MNDLLLDILIAISAFFVMWITYSSLVKNKKQSQPGTKLLIIGFAFILFRFLIDISDNFPHLNQYIIFDDISAGIFLKKDIFSFIGLVLIGVGFYRWLPALLELSLANININKLNNSLKQLVDKRTIELARANQKLHEEKIDREKAQNKLDKQMLHDPLTELPNRYALLEYLEREKVLNTTNSNNIVMFIIDLDQFKAVNDSLGHIIGDKVIQTIGNRLAFNHRKDDFLGRLGGDEFVLVMPMSSDEQLTAIQAYKNATNLIELVAAELKVDKHQFNLSASIGITVFNYIDMYSSEDILRQADIALYNAKEKGTGFFSFFQPKMQRKAQVRLEESKELHDALANKELFLQYQPQVNSHGKFIGMEALLRWNHPTKGIVDPAIFIALSEEIGIIDKLGRYILHMACQQCKELTSSYYPEDKLKIAINISPSHFLQEDFIEQIQLILAEYSLSNIKLVLEITEEIMINDLNDVISKINKLRNLEVHCSLDDFGTGYSSLTHLKELPIDSVKIDKSFIQELHENKDDASIVEAILTMTRALEIDVIAEGIENQTQYQFLSNLGCQYYQGYYFGKPQSIAALIADGYIIDKRTIN